MKNWCPALAAPPLTGKGWFGKAAAPDPLAGLPLEGGRLSPALFERAALRAGLSSRIVRQTLDHIEPALLPAVLLLDGEQACVLLARDVAAGSCDWQKANS